MTNEQLAARLEALSVVVSETRDLVRAQNGRVRAAEQDIAVIKTKISPLVTLAAAVASVVTAVVTALVLKFWHQS